ncbi:MAG: DNA polymerase Y family protein [Myxococcota bacterium]
MRIACLRVADLPLAAEQRAHPERIEPRFAVATGTQPRAELISVSRAAAQEGVRRGMSVAHARSVCASLELRVASPALDQATREALLDAAFACAPRAELVPRGSGFFSEEAVVFVDASGTGSLFRSERGFATALAAAARRLGLAADVTVASSRTVALLAARQLSLPTASSSSEEPAERVLCLVEAQETSFLAPLPIDLLDPEDAVAETLTQFGVRRIRDLLRLPRRGLATRIGAPVLRLIAEAQGKATDPPLPEAHETALREALDLEYPAGRLEPLLFVLQGLLSRLIERLDARHLGCGDWQLELVFEDQGRDVRQIGVAAPTQDLRVLMRLVHQSLESRPPTAPVASVSLEARGLPLCRDQLDLFRPAGPAPAVLGETLAALQSLCGEARVGRPVASDTHHPDRYALEEFAPPKAQSDEKSAGAFTGGLALRAFRPPLRVQVQLQADTPVRIRSSIANGRVVRCAGPWRTTGGWWSPEGRFAFDSYDVETEDGWVVRLRFDHRERAWQIDAVYD